MTSLGKALKEQGDRADSGHAGQITPPGWFGNALRPPTRARGDGQGEGDLGISAKTAAPMDGMNELFYNKN